jgi:hypothetical protein
MRGTLGGTLWEKQFQYELRTPNLGCQSPSLGWIDYCNPQLSAIYVSRFLAATSNKNKNKK